MAILDTGVADVADLAGKLVGGATGDPHGHGTWMAGIVAATTDNGIGIAGVGYDGVSVLPITVLGADGVGYDSAIIDGIYAAITADADVILMAFSSPNQSAALQKAVNDALSAGVVLVASVGNDASTAASYPAGYPGVIGVAATDQSDALAATSNSGSSAYIAAPGVGITTLSAGGGTTTINGTSAAAANVAGAAALLTADGLGASSVAGRLSGTADATNVSIGRLNLAGALAQRALRMWSLSEISAVPKQMGRIRSTPLAISSP